MNDRTNEVVKLGEVNVTRRQVLLWSGAAAGAVALAPRIAKAVELEKVGSPTMKPALDRSRSPYYQKPGVVNVSITKYATDAIREIDVPIKMRDGVTTMYSNVYRPAGEGKHPVVLVAQFNKESTGSGPYDGFKKGQSGHYSLGTFSVSECTPFEAPDPGFWVPNGYVVVHVDIRGCSKSGGDFGPNTPLDAQDYYDMIEWAGVQPWSNGNVGLAGISFLAFHQWNVAALNPPHLKAMIPWEGLTDHYRDNAFHGGVKETAFRIQAYGPRPGRHNPPNYAAMLKLHPLFDEYWQSKNAKLEAIRVPALIAASWSEQGNHSRGSFEGFKHISSKQKWLYTLGGLEWETGYAPEVKALQLEFFDHFLKGKPSKITEIKPVRLDIRKSRDEFTVEYAEQWPPANTKYTALYLDAAANRLRTSKVATTAVASYDSVKGGSVAFDYRFDRNTKVVGNSMLKLWVSAEEADDLDLFVGIRKYDAAGNEVFFNGFGGDINNIVTRGWLRVSAREKDEARSKPWQPFLKHERVLKVKAGEIVPVEIEILPTGTLFEKGSTLQLVIQGRDIIDDPEIRHDESVNKGVHKIHCGGAMDAHLLIPSLS